MTYRYVPAKWRLISQLATLLTTAILGVSIAYTPPSVDVKLTIIEQTMNVHIWAWAMIAFGLIGLIVECITNSMKSNNSTLLWVVSICHTVCLSVLLGYSSSAIASLIRTGHWYAFGGPVLGIYMCLMHYVYIKRRYHAD